jgi:multidrug efflux pump subunit AcrA (membrane-fusion protein)
LFILCVIAAGIYDLWIRRQAEMAKPADMPVRTATARRGAIERTLRISGVTAAPRSQFLIAPKLQGTRRDRGSSDLSLTLQYLLPAGVPVKKGQRVAEFDRQFMETRLDDLRAAIVQQEALMRRMEASMELKRVQLMLRIDRAKADAEKAELDLKTASVRSAMQVERFRMNLEAARALHKQLEAELPHLDTSERALIRREEIDMEQARRELSKAEKNAAGMVYHATMDGVLVLKKVSRGAEQAEIQQGEVVGPGLAFAEIVDPSSIVLEANISQVDAELLSYALPARVHFDAYPELELPAKIKSIGAMTRTGGQRAQYVREVPLQLTLNATEERVIPNLSASADIVLERAEDVLILPRECVFRDEANRPYAMVRTESGWARRELDLGIANHTEVAVESGVEEGESVAAEKLSR